MTFNLHSSMQVLDPRQSEPLREPYQYYNSRFWFGHDLKMGDS